MKKKTVIIMIILFFIGLIILLYPSFSNLYNEKFQSKAIKNYESTIANYNKENYEKEFEKAREYNNELSQLQRQFYEFDTLENYNDILNISNTGMIGYLSIPKINVELTIHHGTEEDVLSNSVGHLEGTSLPVGGTGTHSVLSAHRGLPSSKLFTDLDKLEIGDTFTITVLNKTLTYQVDQIKIVKPNEIDDLTVDKDKDYVTLMTCTPYGINTHRLLVRAKRTEGEEKVNYITTEAFKISNLIVTPVVATPIITSSLLIILFKPVYKNPNWKDKYIYPSKSKKEFGGK